ncbi:MAG: hypothetical protein HFF50_07305 [Lawsonibacter sp.]|nr:hypothetical protein [Lawsonibacter sp.]
MAEFEEKLNAILGNQEAMGQILSLARSLSGESAEETPAQEALPSAQTASPSPPPDLSSLLGGLDPKLLQMGTQMFQELRNGGGRSAALLEALRPFLRESRQAKLDQALQLSRVFKLARTALKTMGEGDEEGV